MPSAQIVSLPAQQMTNQQRKEIALQAISNKASVTDFYCYLLSADDQRDTDTWAIHFMDLQQQGFTPERAIGDDGNGLRSAHKMIFPDIPFDYDNFHLSKILMETRRYFRNCHSSSLTFLNNLELKMEEAKLKGNPCRYSRAL